MFKNFLISFLPSTLIFLSILKLPQLKHGFNSVSVDKNSFKIITKITPAAQLTPSFPGLLTTIPELSLSPLVPLPSLSSLPTPNFSEPTKQASVPSPKPTAILSSNPPSSPLLALTVSAAQLDEWFAKYADEYKVNKDLLRQIAVCESDLNPNAHFLQYGGLYQYSAESWAATRRKMNLNDNADLRFNAQEAIKTAAFQISTTGPSAWPNCAN